MVGGPSPGCGDAWCCGCKHGDAACFWIASVRWQDGDCFCALAEPCEPSTVFLKCLPSFCFVAIIVSHSFVPRSPPPFFVSPWQKPRSMPLILKPQMQPQRRLQTTVQPRLFQNLMQATRDRPAIGRQHLSMATILDGNDPRSSSDWQMRSRIALEAAQHDEHRRRPMFFCVRSSIADGSRSTT